MIYFATLFSFQDDIHFSLGLNNLQLKKKKKIINPIHLTHQGRWIKKARQNRDSVYGVPGLKGE